MKKIRKISSIILAFTLLIGAVPVTELYAQSQIVIPTDVQNPSSDCTMLGIEGTYYAEIDKALDRINEIRYEACKEGVIDPGTGLPLTLHDYVPIKWSSDLEYIARIRAAEASVTMGHIRTNGESCFDIVSPNGVRSYGEVLAWNWSDGMIMGINQWYGEKGDWVKQNKNAVTGHYEIMINPGYTYVGLATFCTQSGTYYNSTAGEFCGETGLDETHGTTEKNCIQLLEVKNSAITGKYTINGRSKLKIGNSASLYVATDVSYAGGGGTGLYVVNPIWSSSDPTMVSVQSDGAVFGTVKALSCGSASVIASAGGREVKQTIDVEHKGSASVVKATTSKNGSIVNKCNNCGKIVRKQTIYRPKEVRLSQTSYKYNGKIHHPKVTVVDAAGKKISSSNYTVTYSKGCKKKGTYKVTITFKGNYKGNIVKKFKIE